jgi:hypothetical protein
MTLKCDWNFTTYYITIIHWNESEFSWDKVRQHLINHGNITDEIMKLQQGISETFSQLLKLVSGADLLEGIADGVSNLNP